MYGVDYGVRRVAIACPSQGWAVAHLIAGDDDLAAAANLAEFVCKVVTEPGHVFIESPIAGGSGNVQVAVRLAAVAGAIGSRFPGRASLVAPSSWKALVCGNGSLDKPEVSAWLEREHSALAEACRKPSGKLDQDRVDATCLGLCTVAGLAERSSVPRKRKRPVLRQGPAAGHGSV